jgi:hypothetical protein
MLSSIITSVETAATTALPAALCSHNRMFWSTT